MQNLQEAQHSDLKWNQLQRQKDLCIYKWCPAFLSRYSFPFCLSPENFIKYPPFPRPTLNPLPSPSIHHSLGSPSTNICPARRPNDFKLQMNLINEGGMPSWNRYSLCCVLSPPPPSPVSIYIGSYQRAQTFTPFNHISSQKSLNWNWIVKYGLFMEGESATVLKVHK